MLDSLITLGAADLGQVASDITNTYKVNLPYFIAQVLNFLLVAFLLYRFAFKPVLAILDERQRKINDGLQYAEEMKHKLADTEKKYNELIKQGNQEAQRIIEEARDHAKRITERQTQDAVARAEELIHNAQRAAVQEHEKMLAEVRKEVAQLVVLTTSKVLKQELSDSDRQRYNDSAARELAANN